MGAEEGRTTPVVTEPGGVNNWGGVGARGAEGRGGATVSIASSSLSISMSPTSVRSSLHVGSEVAVCWARSKSFCLAVSFWRQPFSCAIRVLYTWSTVTVTAIRRALT